MGLFRQSTYLIINADDYGYSKGVSRGILSAHQRGVLTATGIFANSASFDEHVSWLSNYPGLDLGVHLTLTSLGPLTVRMRGKLLRWNGLFPAKFALVKAMLSGAITAEDVKVEWRAQVQRCINAGLNIRFLNSHEHLHMFPPLYAVIWELAREYAIPQVRFSTSILFHRRLVRSFARDVSLKCLEFMNWRNRNPPAPLLIGMERSGKLDMTYFRTKLQTLRSGMVYELMCHPGYYDSEIKDPHLINYHDWQGELDFITDPSLPGLLRDSHVRLIGYRDLDIVDGKLTVGSNASLERAKSTTRVSANSER